jgi:hypothetical protein
VAAEWTFRISGLPGHPSGSGESFWEKFPNRNAHRRVMQPEARRSRMAKDYEIPGAPLRIV